MNNSNPPASVAALLDEFRRIIELAEAHLNFFIEEWKRQGNKTATGYMMGCDSTARQIDRWKSLMADVEDSY